MKSILFLLFSLAAVLAVAQDAPPASSLRIVGTVASIQGNVVTVNSDAGVDVTFTVPATARLRRTTPGATSLKDAAIIQLADLQKGDRVLARTTGADSSLVATSIVVMKQSDVAAKQSKEKEEWNRSGVGGLVKTVDPAAATITLSTPGVGATKTITVTLSKDTIVRRYADDSVKFDDAKLSTIAAIKPGDQLRARGAKNADGSEIAAEEIVAGTFRNVAGTVLSVDAANNTISVMDLATKKPVVVKITPESQMHKLPQFVAMAIAMRLRGITPPGMDGAAPANGAPPMNARPQGERAPGGSAGRPPEGGQHQPMGGGGGRGDLGQMLSRMPALSLTELQKGDALMIVSTEGNGNEVQAVTLLSGVEPILSAPNAAQASSILSPWNIGTSVPGEQ